MHSPAIRNEFLRLRIQGLSLASIGRQLGVSKPTLIKWGRQSQPEIDTRAAEDQQHVTQEITSSANQEIADLTRKLGALRQELFSRALRDIPTVHLETLSGQLRQRIESLQSANGCAPEAPSDRGSAIQHPATSIQNPGVEPIRT